jgi:DNA modification methylase
MKFKEYLDGRIKIYNCDCADIMKTIEAKSIDLVLTDPPYGLNYDKIAYRNGGTNSKNAFALKTKYLNTDWDYLPEAYIFNDILKISKNQIIFGAEHLCLMLPPSRGWLVWDKHTGENSFSDCELAWTSFNKPIKKYDFVWTGMIQQNMKEKEKRVHPTQKPIKLFSKILNNYSQENDLIFDGFLGSGTTALACIQTNRRFIGTEINTYYFELACNRIEDELRQLDFFRIENH